ncbi:MAG: SRPBCC family protein [Archangium sp.]|nr:SRPBCC family protein [Archangium sp.]
MVRDAVSEEISAPCEAVFDLVHDYAQRLKWDTLLREAFMEENAPPATGNVAVCSGKWLVGGITLRTVYVSFQRGKVAAVKMVNTPPGSAGGAAGLKPPFRTWAASIRHEPLPENRSRVIYTWHFNASPAFLEPVMARFFRWETARRLRALKAWFAAT